MTIRRSFNRALLVLIAVVVVTSALLPSVGQAALEATSPSTSNSSPTDLYFHNLRKRNDIGNHPNLRLSAYFDNNNDSNPSKWDGTLAVVPDILNGRPVCDLNTAGKGSNATYMEVYMYASGGDAKTYYVPTKNACSQNSTRVNGEGNNDANIFFAKYPLPRPTAIDKKSDKYRVNIEIKYSDDVTSVVNGDIFNRVRLRTQLNRGIVAPRGLGFDSSGVAFSLMARESLATPYPGRVGQASIPFMMDCNDSSAGDVQATFRIYDADNGTMVAYLKASVQNVTDGIDRVALSNNGPQQDGGRIEDNWLIPNDGNKGLAQATFNMKKGNKYRLRVINIAYGNTIDVGVPTDVRTSDCDDSGGGVARETINITPNIEALSSSVETGGTVDFKSSATVDGFPEPERKGWGYKEVAIKKAKNTNTAPVSKMYDRTITEDATETSEVKTMRKCGNNTFHQDCTNYKSPSGELYRCGDTHADDSCNSAGNLQTHPSGNHGGFVWKCKWEKANETTIYSREFTNDTDPCRSWRDGKIYKYTCDNYLINGTGAQAAQRTFGNDSTAWNCQAWKCPDPSEVNNLIKDERNVASTDCKIFACAYNMSATFAARDVDGATNRCQKRCNDGAGERAYNQDAGDDNCYVKPKFSITCTWSAQGAGSGGPPLPTSVTEEVTYEKFTAGDTFCNKTFTLPAGNIDTRISMTIKVNRPTNPSLPNNAGAWSPNNPMAGWGKDANTDEYRLLKLWLFNVEDASGLNSQEVDVVGKPYVKVYGGDVRVGQGVFVEADPWARQCTANANAKIEAYHILGESRGSGTQLATFARGANSQFASAQGSPDPNPIALAFANANQYGGNWDGPLPCVVVKDSQGYAALGDTWAGGTVDATTGNKKVDGDLLITGDVTYDEGSISSLQKMPRFRVVVAGNIYIAPDVTRLDGTYIAMGDIYTCANDANVAAMRPAMCRKQLVVNGALAANNVHFWRSCSSLARSVVNEPSIASGGTDEQQCSASNHAAEVVNYTADQWLDFGNAVEPRYDSMVMLPPIL